MRIAIITPSVGELFGQERVIAHTVQLLHHEGHEVYVLAGTVRGNVKDAKGVCVVPGLTGVHLLTPPQDRKRIHTNAMSYLSLLNPEVVHLIDTVDADFLEMLTDRFPTIYTAHSVGPTCPSGIRLTAEGNICAKKSGWRCLLNHAKTGCLGSFSDYSRRIYAVSQFLPRKKALKKIPKVLAPSDYIRKVLIHDGWDKSRIEVLANPVLTPRASKKRKDTPKNLFVAISRLERLKGLEHAIDSLKHLNTPDCHLWIAGEGNYRKELESLIAKLKLESQVKLLGRLNFDEIPNLMVSARAVIQPNTGPESFGLSAAEAACLGVPVIASDVPALNEWIQPGITGLLVPPADPQALAKAMDRVLTDNLLVERMTSYGKTRLRPQLNGEQYVKRLLEIYHSVAPESRTRKAS